MADFIKILYVEDEKVAYDIVKRFLGKGYDLQWAENAETALKMMEQNKYEIILMDISLKNSISGLDLTRLIRMMPDYIDIPIIAVTAHAMVGDKERILDSGCNAYLAKPFSRKDLIAIVESQLANINRSAE